MNECMYVCVCMYVCMYVCVCVYIYVCKYVCVCISLKYDFIACSITAVILQTTYIIDGIYLR